MGYDAEKKGFKLLDLNQPKNFFVERSVVFNEDRFPAKELKLGKENIKIRNPNDDQGTHLSTFTELVVTRYKSNPESNRSSSEEYSTTSISRMSDDQIRSRSESEEYSTTSSTRVSDNQSAELINST